MPSTLSPSFSLPTMKTHERNRGLLNENMLQNPGPGAYEPKIKTGESIICNSIYRSPNSISIYHHDRFPRREKNSSNHCFFIYCVYLGIPGPGQYCAPSDFGHYGSKM